MKPPHIAAIAVTVIICATALIIYFDLSKRSQPLSLSTNIPYSAPAATPKQSRTKTTTLQQSAISQQQKRDAEVNRIKDQMNNPDSYISIVPLSYDVRLLKTSRLKIRLTNETSQVYYENIEVALTMYEGERMTVKRATFKGRLAPLEDAEFYMYENGITSVNSSNFQISSTNAFVAPEKAAELGMD